MALRPAPARQRARGVVRLEGVRRANGSTAIVTRYEEGSLRARLPRQPHGAPPEIVLLNTAGGLTGGDRMSVAAGAGDGASLVLTTQACERIYRADEGTATVETRLSVGAGARVDYVPQETILFDRAHLMRRLDVDLAGDATLLAVEAVIFGRRAMGEEVRTGAFRDRWRVRRDGRLVFADETRLDGPIAETLDRPAVLGGGRALATLLHAGPDADARLGVLREALRAAEDATGGAVAGGASAFDGLLVARMAARDGTALREALLAALGGLLRGRALPKVWFC